MEGKGGGSDQRKVPKAGQPPRGQRTGAKKIAVPRASHPQLLHQVHVSTLVLLHAALGDAGHVRSQGSVDEHAQHVQHRGEELAEAEVRVEGGKDR